jgi:mRNA-degrading endonuclease RelE of RelBE toxin-antitoxin system
MTKTFVETTDFSRWRARFLSDEDYAKLQEELIGWPQRGDVMPGCGGLRKLRIRDRKRQRGKRGGARLIYLHVPEAGQFLMLDVYGKDEKDDLTAQEKKELSALAREYRKQVLEAARRAAE